MRGAQTAKVVTLHRTGKTFTDRGAGNIHELTFKVMVSRDFLAHVDHGIGVHTELRHFTLGRHIGRGKVTAHGLACAFCLGRACAQLNSGVTVLIGGALGNNLQAVELKNGHRNLLAVFLKDTGHPDLFCDNTRAQHNLLPSLTIAA